MKHSTLGRHVVHVLVMIKGNKIVTILARNRSFAVFFIFFLK